MEHILVGLFELTLIYWIVILVKTGELLIGIAQQN